MDARDLESLSLFLERMARIQRTRLIQLINEHGLNVEIWERPDGELVSVFPEIPETDLDAFLFNWRLFVQNNDRISVGSIKKVLSAAPLPSDIVTEFTTAVKALNLFLDSPPLMNEKGAENNRQFLDTMLYGQFAHLTPDKYDLVQGWGRSFGRSELLALFVATLDEASRLLFQLAKSVAAAEAHLRQINQ